MEPVAFTVTQADTLAAYRLHGRPSPRGLILGLLAGSAIGCAFVWFTGRPALAFAAAIPAVLLWFALSYLLLQRVVLPRRIRRIYHQQVVLRSEVHLAWSAAGLTATTERASSQTPWTDYATRREDAQSILLYHSDALFQFIPRRVLSKPQQSELAALYAAVPLKP